MGVALNENWLLTGGAGYIGSHVVRALLERGHTVVVLDDLSTGKAERIPPSVPLIETGIGDTDAVRKTLRDHAITGVIHLAAKKSVPESIERPLFYYQQNVADFVSLLTSMQAEGVNRLVFSSSAAVYGTTDESSVVESSSTRPDSPYGRTKLIGEWMVRDAVRAHSLAAVSLRYFNVVGCGENSLADREGSNLFPIVIRSIQAGEPVRVFGGEHPTTDGTCVRDYIHVVDLAQAHVAACDATATPGCDEIVNIGCGRGYSVLEVLDEFSRQIQQPVERVIVPAREGDPAAMVAQATTAADVLGWSAKYSLSQMVASAWAAR